MNYNMTVLHDPLDVGPVQRDYLKVHSKRFLEPSRPLAKVSIAQSFDSSVDSDPHNRINITEPDQVV